MKGSSRLRRMLVHHEGLRLTPYKCPAGKLTIGVGRNLEDAGISEKEALFLLDNDIKLVKALAYNNYPWFRCLNVARQDVILSMIFNLGFAGFSKFKRTISAVEQGHYLVASTEMLDSRWATQVKGRAIELATMMQTGRYW